MFSHFSNKIIRRTDFGNNAKKIVKNQVSTNLLNHRSNTLKN